MATRTYAKVAALFGGASSSPPPNWPIGKVWASLPVQERAVQWAAYFADVAKVRESGTNAGYWVKQFLARVGLPVGYAWCAAFMTDLCIRAGWFKFKSAAVLRWRDWGNEELVTYYDRPERGMLAYWVRGSGKSQKRHIEMIIRTEGHPTTLDSTGKVPKGYVLVIGGNTSSGKSGSQEDGDGVFRRLRRVSEYTGFIKWWKV